MGGSLKVAVFNICLILFCTACDIFSSFGSNRQACTQHSNSEDWRGYWAPCNDNTRSQGLKVFLIRHRSQILQRVRGWVSDEKKNYWWLQCRTGKVVARSTTLSKANWICCAKKFPCVQTNLWR